jgi:peptide/nickel transport system substrate-binding protein
VAAHPDTPTTKSKIERTAAYTALDDSRVQWVGLPGFFDPTYFTNFWPPLPQHAWGHYTPAEMLTAPDVNRAPLGDGPFQLVEWVAGDYLRLEPNPAYYRTAEGFPRLDSVTFRFLPNPDARMTQILTGGCDVITQDALDVSQAAFLAEAQAAGLLQTYFQIGEVYEAIALGVNSWGNYGDGAGRPDWFETAPVRQALALCLNRPAMVAEVGNGRAPLMHAQIPAIHPLYPPTITTWPYDPAAGNALLDDAGYRDEDGDGRREDPQTGQPFHITFTTTTRYESNRLIAQQVQTDLQQCGIEVDLIFLPGETWYAAGEESPLFGRRFDLGHIAWPVEATDASSLCHLFASWQITGPAGKINPQTGTPYGSWDALNNTGWWLPQYDDACRKTLSLLPDMPGYEENFQETQRLLADNLPMIPLFMRLKLAAAHPHVRHFTLDATQDSELWNIYALDLSLDE